MHEKIGKRQFIGLGVYFSVLGLDGKKKAT
jgi:hypothetical protein